MALPRHYLTFVIIDLHSGGGSLRLEALLFPCTWNKEYEASVMISNG